jgi:hypothetical protein
MNEYLKKLQRTIQGTGRDMFFFRLLLINVFILFIRPQNDIPILAKIQMPLILSSLSISAWLANINRGWTKTLTFIWAFLCLCGLSVLIAANTRYSYEGTRTVFQLFIGIIFPMIVIVQSGSIMRKLLFWLGCLGPWLSFYSFVYGGHGPGDYLGDENDLCLALLMFLGFESLLFLSAKTTFGKVSTLAGCMLILGGIVKSQSRGGFLGLLALAGYTIYRSPKRMQIISAGVFVVLCGLPFVPREYWSDMQTITDTEESTAHQRKEFWAAAFDIWSRKENVLFGVGVYNLPFQFSSYQNSKGKSIYGRAVHSMYFQLLPELGLTGVFAFLGVVFCSVFGNERVLKLKKRMRKVVQSIDDPQYAKVVNRELDWFSVAAAGLNASWLGVLAAGAFVSVLYYPPVWFLAGISSALQLYAKKFERTLLQNFNEHSSTQTILEPKEVNDV